VVGGVKWTAFFMNSLKESNFQLESPVMFAHCSYAELAPRWYLTRC
jgi:hypothetical protein